MSAKKEKELRKQLAVCEELTKQHDRMMQLHRRTGEELDAQLGVIEAQQREIVFLRRDVNRLKEWRYECIERRMERAAHVRKARKIFGVVGMLLWVLFICVGRITEQGNLDLIPGVALMIGVGTLAYVCMGKAGWLDL